MNRKPCAPTAPNPFITKKKEMKSVVHRGDGLPPGDDNFINCNGIDAISRAATDP
jgi:hypothetical protein